MQGPRGLLQGVVRVLDRNVDCASSANPATQGAPVSSLVEKRQAPTSYLNTTATHVVADSDQLTPHAQQH
jgi:hypothetical protein